MRQFFLLIAFVCSMPLCLMAQEDDLYFVPKKGVKTSTQTEKVERGRPTCVPYSRDVDEYNRRGKLKSYYEKIGVDSLGNDIIEFREGDGMYPEDLEAEQIHVYPGSESYYDETEDYAYSRRMSRFDDYYGFYSPSYYSYYDYYWNYPYRYSRWGWYDPWYYGWSDPWYSFSWYSPYYYRYSRWGWYDPWYYGWRGGYYPGYRVVTRYKGTPGTKNYGFPTRNQASGTKNYGIGTGNSGKGTQSNGNKNTNVRNRGLGNAGSQKIQGQSPQSSSSRPTNNSSMGNSSRSGGSNTGGSFGSGSRSGGGTTGGGHFGRKK